MLSVGVIVLSANVSAGTWNLSCHINADKKGVLIINDSGRFLESYRYWTLMIHDSEGELLLKRKELSFDENLPKGESRLYSIEIPAGGTSCTAGYTTPSTGP